MQRNRYLAAGIRQTDVKHLNFLLDFLQEDRYLVIVRGSNSGNFVA